MPRLGDSTAASTPILACVLFLIFNAAAVATMPSAAAAVTIPVARGGGSDEPTTTCVPTLQRLLSCLDFIEHRTDAIPQACCVQVNATVAQQPCCLMHVLRGDVAKLIGPEFDSTRAMVDVTMKCIGDASILVSITASCAGKPLPPLTPEYPFTAALPPPPSSGAEWLEGLSSTVLLLALLACFL